MRLAKGSNVVMCLPGKFCGETELVHSKHDVEFFAKSRGETNLVNRLRDVNVFAIFSKFKLQCHDAVAPL